MIERATEDISVPSGAQESATLPLSGVTPVRGVGRSEEERPGAWRPLLDALPTALVLLNSDLRVEFVNAAFQRRIGTLDEGEDVARFFSRRELEAACERLHRGGSVRLSGQATTRSGARDVALDLTLVRLEREEYVCVTCQLEERSDPGLSLERLDAAQVPAARLNAVQRQAVTTNLAAAVAHEVNNMLSVIMASAELATRSLDRAQDPKDDLERVGEASERAAEVLGDLLRFLAKRGEQAEDLEPEQALLELSRLVESGVRRGIQLRLRLEATPPVRVVRSHFEASVLSLIDNAREALGGTGTISLVTEQRELSAEEAAALDLDPGKYASIRIADSGPGMCSEVLKCASEPFFTTKVKVASAGLGLTAVRAFARASHGGLALTSAPGQGTTAELLLPLSATSSARNEPS